MRTQDSSDPLLRAGYSGTKEEGGRSWKPGKRDKQLGRQIQRLSEVALDVGEDLL